MRVAAIHEFGPPEALVSEEREAPTATPGQVVIDAEYSSITFVETQVRAGKAPNPAMLPPLPAVLGNGIGGQVRAVGDPAMGHLVGRSVVSTTGGRGGYAESVAVDAALPIEVPVGLAVADAVALLADGRTALALMELAGVQPGQTVLVEAAAGGVGGCLVQLAKAVGARVVACAGSEGKLRTSAELGADVQVDYSEEGWTRALAAERVDVVFDGVGGSIGLDAYGLLQVSGTFCQYGMASGGFTELPAATNGHTVHRGINLTPARSRTLSAQVLDLAAAGKLRPVVGQIFALEDAAGAHRAMEARTTIGKTLLRTRTRVNGL